MKLSQFLRPTIFKSILVSLISVLLTPQVFAEEKPLGLVLQEMPKSTMYMQCTKRNEAGDCERVGLIDRYFERITLLREYNIAIVKDPKTAIEFTESLPKFRYFPIRHAMRVDPEIFEAVTSGLLLSTPVGIGFLIGAIAGAGPELAIAGGAILLFPLVVDAATIPLRGLVRGMRVANRQRIERVTVKYLAKMLDPSLIGKEKEISHDRFNKIQHIMLASPGRDY